MLGGNKFFTHLTDMCLLQGRTVFLVIFHLVLELHMPGGVSVCVYKTKWCYLDFCLYPYFNEFACFGAEHTH